MDGSVHDVAGVPADTALTGGAELHGAFTSRSTAETLVAFLIARFDLPFRRVARPVAAPASGPLGDLSSAVRDAERTLSI